MAPLQAYNHGEKNNNLRVSSTERNSVSFSVFSVSLWLFVFFGENFGGKDLDDCRTVLPCIGRKTRLSARIA